MLMCFPGGSEGKESACNAGDPGSTPGLGGSLGEGNGNPFQYSCLENSHGQRSLAGYHMDSDCLIHCHISFITQSLIRGTNSAHFLSLKYGVAKSRTQMSNFTHLDAYSNCTYSFAASFSAILWLHRSFPVAS